MDGFFGDSWKLGHSTRIEPDGSDSADLVREIFPSLNEVKGNGNSAEETYFKLRGSSQ